MNKSILYLFGEFPREILGNKIFIKNKEDFSRILNEVNGLMNCYTSIYKIRKDEFKYKNGRKIRDYKSVVINKIYFDLDTFSTCWNSTKKMHDILLNKLDLQHCIILSGGGFHIYVITKDFKLEDLSPETPRTEERLKIVIRNAFNDLLLQINKFLDEKNKITVGNPKKCDIDYHVRGDIARIARIPNTWHPKRKRYSIPIFSSDFDKSFDEILEISKNQREGVEIFGNNKLELSQYDRNIAEIIECELNDIKTINVNSNSVISLLPLFIQNLLVSGEDGHRARYLTILSMKIRGFPKSLAIDVCKQYWSNKKFHHALYGHNHNTFDDIYSRPELFFPNWKTLIEEGWKIPKEDFNYKDMDNR